VNGSGNKGKDTKTAGVIQVADFLGDGAVAIEKNGGAQRGLLRHAAPGSNLARVLQPLRPCRQ